MAELDQTSAAFDIAHAERLYGRRERDSLAPFLKSIRRTRSSRARREES